METNLEHNVHFSHIDSLVGCHPFKFLLAHESVSILVKDSTDQRISKNINLWFARPYLKARSALFLQYVSLSGSATWKSLSMLHCFKWRINASLCIWRETIYSNNLTISPHFASIVSDPPDRGDVLLGEVHPVLLTQSLILLDGDCAVSAEIKLFKNIVECCVNIKVTRRWKLTMKTLPLCSLCSFFILPTVW